MSDLSSVVQKGACWLEVKDKEKLFCNAHIDAFRPVGWSTFSLAILAY
jgi:hypothetical protein